MSGHRSSWLQRLLRRLLVKGRGEVRAMEDAMHLEGVLRFAGLFVITILLPTALLTYFGVTSVATEESSVRTELQRTATVTADTFWSSTDRKFSGVEERIQGRLMSGRSPLETPAELHPHIVAALRFDETGLLQAPFILDDKRNTPPTIAAFHPAVVRAGHAERQGRPPTEVARLYASAAAEVPWPATRNRMRFDQGRMHAKAGDNDLSEAIFEQLTQDSPTLRDPWGFRLGDLARLASGQLRLASPDVEIHDKGEQTLRQLVDDLMGTRWVVGQGAEAAVVRQALSVLEPSRVPGDWIAAQRSRLSERGAALYWTEQLLPEVTPFVADAGRQRGADGALRWVAGEQAIWVTTWWGGGLYAFALHREALLAELKADARASALADAAVSAHLIAPDEPFGDQILVTKPLSPWLTGWSIVVEARDPEALAEDRANKRRRRIGIILLAVGMIAVGTVTTVRLMKNELDVARMQADFAASVSHELRSPITHIRVHAESLMFDLMDNEEEKEEAYVHIVRESERLSRLVDNVLDFAAIERGAKQYHLRPSDLTDTVLRAITSISSAQEVRDKELDVNLPHDLPQVHLDADAVAQCIINLVSNAAKYSDKGGWIGVRGRVVERGVEITISDKGIGIAPHDLRQIFEPFFRSRDALARRRKGTGIGLAITRYIMRAHGGDVQVQSRPGKGSTFTLRFPLRPPEDTRGKKARR